MSPKKELAKREIPQIFNPFLAIKAIIIKMAHRIKALKVLVMITVTLSNQTAKAK